MRERILYRYTSIEQFRQINYEVKRRAEFIGLNHELLPMFNVHRPKPTLRFKGQVKLHGMNIGIVLTNELDLYTQCREMVLGEDNELNGVHAYAMEHQQRYKQLLSQHLHEGVLAVVLYGEWAGTGTIKKGNTAISGIQPSLFVFDVCKIMVDMVSDGNGGLINRREWVEDTSAFDSPAMRLYSMAKFPSFTVDIDFNDPAPALALIESHLAAVVAQCPVGGWFGLEGFGEGLVWRNTDRERMLFKVAGTKHKRTKTMEPIPMDPELVKSIAEFAERTVTESRLEQGLDKLAEMGLRVVPRSLGVFLKWVYDDIVKEESDTLAASGIDPKLVGKDIQNIAKPWYVTRMSR